MKVEVNSKKRVFDGFFKIDEASLKHEKFDGSMSDQIFRLNFDRGDSVAAIIFDKNTNEVILTKQFRYPVFTKENDAWILEAVAGMIKNETPLKCLRREIKEELGYITKDEVYIGTFYVSPGGTNERIFLFYVEDITKTASGGGVKYENEDIKLIRISINKAISMIGNEIKDAKTIIGLQWLLLNKTPSMSDWMQKRT